MKITTENINTLYKEGILKINFPLPMEYIQAAKERNWNKVDQLISKDLLDEKSKLSLLLKKFHDFDTTEHLIAIRHSDDDEDGIWHDDGSRHLAFTWSLNEKPQNIKGGELFFRKKNSTKILRFSPPIQGTLIIFLTGQYGFEHKVNKVLEGERKTIVGWCTSNIKPRPYDQYY